LRYSDKAGGTVNLGGRLFQIPTRKKECNLSFLRVLLSPRFDAFPYLVIITFTARNIKTKLQSARYWPDKKFNKKEGEEEAAEWRGGGRGPDVTALLRQK
jgi:hypothetical protein